MLYRVLFNKFPYPSLNARLFFVETLNICAQPNPAFPVFILFYKFSHPPPDAL